jgi:hypothetical protein
VPTATNWNSSVATSPSPVDEDFDYGGTPAPMEVDSAITLEDVRAAAREFLITGRQSGGSRVG